MSIPVIDLHCDLLAYLGEDLQKHSPLDDIVNCSIPQLEKGRVRLQTLAIFTETGPGSHRSFLSQVEAYRRMLKNFSGRVAPFSGLDLQKERVHFILAIENLSGLLEEDEKLDQLLKRLDGLNDQILYVSLTWKGENRFGGGDGSKAGLKDDGQRALEWLAEKKIAVDFSHTSDALADAILNYIHKKGLTLRVLASHSNFRVILNIERNLPDRVAQEIARMGGVIGINFVRAIVGDRFEDFLQQIRYGMDLVGEEVLALGADFFGGIDLDRIAHLAPFYQKEFNTSACYPLFLKQLASEFSSEQIEKVAYRNALRYLGLAKE